MEMRTNFTITLFHLIKSNSETKLIRVKNKKSTHKNLSILNFHNQLFFGRESSIKTNELQIVLGVVSECSIDSVMSHLGFPLLLMSKIDPFIYF